MLKKQYFISAIVFLILIFIFPIMIFLSKKKEFSEIENRTLEKFPEMNAEKIMDKSYMDNIESYLSDHFPFRTGWVKAKLNLEAATGKELINGIYITNDRLYEKLPEPDYKEIEISADAINKFAEKYKDTSVYVMIAPTSSSIYEDKLERYMTQINQKKLTNDIYDKLDHKINKLDVFSTLYSVRNEYIYYRTDHHWTSKGAFTAYKFAAGKMGLKIYENYTEEKASDDFRGTFYSKCMYSGVEPDIINIYRPENNTKAVSVTLKDGLSDETANDIYFPEFLETNDKYCVFLGHNRPLTKIITNAPTTRRLLIIKDSYANSIVPFFIQNYSEIAIIDPRYIKTSITNYVSPDRYDHTLFLYNASTFSTDKNIKNISY